MRALTIDQPLTRRQVLGFFFIALLVYIYPLMHADYSYYDDVYRSAVADASWTGEGRPLIQLFYYLLGFNGRTPNLFPLPLLISVFLMAFALRRLVFFSYDKPVFSSCLVALPILYSPFFLQNLTYQYDGAAMVLSLVAIIYAVTLRLPRRWMTCLIAVGLIAAALALYQVSVNFLIALCCFELIRYVEHKVAVIKIFSMMAYRMVVVILGGAIYYMSVYLFMDKQRMGTLPLNSGTAFELFDRSMDIARIIIAPFPIAFKVLMVGVAALAIVGYFRVGRRVVDIEGKRLHKYFLMFSYLMVFPVLYFSMSGICLFFLFFNSGYRTLLGLSGGLYVIFFLSHKVLVSMGWRSGFALVLPLMYSLSISFAYGRALVLQKEFETGVLTRIAYDIEHSELSGVGKIYLINTWDRGELPAAEGLSAAMPILNELPGISYVVLAEMFSKVGISNVYTSEDEALEARIKNGAYKALLKTKIYEFYLIDGTGYLITRPLQSALSGG